MEVIRYVTESGEDVVGDWLEDLNDSRAEAKVIVRIDRLAKGNFGDCKRLGSGISELRINWGPGYRVYFSIVDRQCVLLLCAGDKRRQSADIDRAIEYLKDYEKRAKKS